MYAVHADAEDKTTTPIQGTGSNHKLSCNSFWSSSYNQDTHIKLHDNYMVDYMEIRV